MWDRDLSDGEAAFFDAFMYAASTVQRGVDGDLAYEQHLSLREYTVLSHLAAAPDRRLRINEVAAACMLSLSRVSRLVEKLETRGLVRRMRASTDGRGWHAVLTPQGDETLRKSRTTYAGSVRRHVLDHVEPSQLAALTRLARRIAQLPAS